MNAGFTGDDKPQAFLERLLGVFTAFVEGRFLRFAFADPFLKQSLYLSREKQPFSRVFSKNFFLVYRGAPVEEIKSAPTDS